jgi:hypothetical protein
MKKIENLIGALGFFRHVDNWHRLPGLRRLLCRLGRHDWEYRQRVRDGVELECFECGKRKRSCKSKGTF